MEHDSLTLAFYGLAIPSVILVGISKSGFGGAFGSLAVPLLSLVVSPSRGAAIMLPVLLVYDVMGLASFRRRGDWTNLSILIPAAALGIAVGALSFRYMTDGVLRLMIGIVALTFVLQRVAGRSDDAKPARPDWRLGGAWGAVAGFTSFIANAGGPPFTIYMVPQRLDKMLFAGTSVLFFASVNFMKLPVFIGLGLLDLRNLAVSAYLLPFAPLGYWMGLHILRRIDQRVFYKIITVAMGLTGVKLLWDGGRSLL